MAIQYTESIEAIAPDNLVGFFEGWPDPPSPERHLEILAGSAHVVIALDEESGRVVGFVNAISDGVLSAYLPLLEVLPEHRGRGIGRGLVERMMARLDGLYMVDLSCDEGLVPFYRSLGFQRLVGMGRRNYERQSAR
ncbi:MAG: GNAT family N-acetyltransferase [Candidatus Eisenbacteria bacterium]